MHHRAKFGEDPSNRCLYMAILLLSRWRRSAMLNFTVDRVHTAKRRHHAKFVEDRLPRLELTMCQWVNGSWIKWVNEYEWVTWVMGHGSVPVIH